MKANILVCGYTGCGKTSLVQAFCDKDVVPDSAVGHAEPKTMEFKYYEIGDVGFWDSKGMELGQTEDSFLEYVTSFVKSHQYSIDQAEQLRGGEQHIHILWYCIAGDRARVTKCDRNLIEQLFDTTLVVVTKNDIIKRKQRKAIIAELLEIGVNEKNVMLCSSDNRSGLKRLLERTRQLMPDAQCKYLEDLYIEKENELKASADTAAINCITWATIRAAAIAVSPLPLADVPFLAGNEAYMITEIGSAYGVAVTQSMITGFLGALGATWVGFTLASFLPGFKIVVATSITYSVGYAAKLWFEKNMNMSDKELKEAYELGKKEVKKTDWKNKAKDFELDEDELK